MRDYTPYQGVRAGVADINQDFPDEILIEMNVRNRQAMDVHRLNLSTGALTPTRKPATWGWGADAKFQVRGPGLHAGRRHGDPHSRRREVALKTLLKVGPEEILNFGTSRGTESPRI